MNQSSVIGAALIVAYVVFIIYRGELPCYMQVLGITTKAGCPPNLQPAGCSGAPTTSTSPSSTGSTPRSVNPPGTTTGSSGNLGGGGMIGIPRIGTSPGNTTIDYQSY